MPADARPLGKTIRIGLIAILALIVASILILIVPHHKAAAKGLLPELGSVELQLGGTPLQKLLTPVTDTTNKILPLDVNPGGKSVGVKVQPDVALPVVGKPSQPVVSLSLPVQAQGSPPAAARVNPTTQQPSSETPVAATPPAVSQATPTSSPTSFQLASASNMSMPQKLLPFMSLGSPATLGVMTKSERPAVRTSVEKQDFTATIISMVIFFAILAIIANLLYIAERGGMIWEGEGRLATLSQKYDLTQLSVFAVATVGATAIVVLLIAAKP